MGVSQPDFAAALLDPERAVPPGLTDPQGRPAGARFAVYRNTVAASLTEALETGFPAVAALVGTAFFRAMAGVFLRAHPPEDPRLTLWGGRFPGFLAGFEPVAHLPYLPDVARLELGLRQSYHAADAAPLALDGQDPAALLAARPRLAPATLVLPSRFPVLAIWRRATDAAAPRPVPGPTEVLITRPVYDPVARALPRGGRAVARRLKGRLTLADALTEAQAEDPDLDAAAVLTALLGSGALTLDQGDPT